MQSFGRFLHRVRGKRNLLIAVGVAGSVVAALFVLLLAQNLGISQAQARKIDSTLLEKYRELPPDSRVLVWFDIPSDIPITSGMLTELSDLGAGIQTVSHLINAIAAEIKIGDLPKFADLTYISYIYEVEPGTLE